MYVTPERHGRVGPAYLGHLRAMVLISRGYGARAA